MHDDSSEIVQLKNKASSALTSLIQCSLPRNDGIRIIESIDGMIDETSKNNRTWILATAYKFLSYQSECIDSDEYQQFYEVIGNAICKHLQATVEENSMLSQTENNSSVVVLIRVLLGHSKILLKYPILLQSQLFDGKIKSLTKTESLSISDELKLQVSQAISCLKERRKSTLLIQPNIIDLANFAQPQSETRKMDLANLAQPQSESRALTYMTISQNEISSLCNRTAPNFTIFSLLEQLPLLMKSVGKLESKSQLDYLIHLAFTCEDRLTKVCLEAAIIKIVLLQGQCGDLFSKSLAEQIYLASFFPFSAKTGTEVFAKDLLQTLMALWKLLLDGKDNGSLEMVVNAVGNMYRENVIPSSQMGPIMNLLSSSSQFIPLPCIKFISEMSKSCTFKHLIELVDLFKAMPASGECVYSSWNLFASLSTTKSPDAFHRRLKDGLIPFMEKSESLSEKRTWIFKIQRLIALEIYARYSTCLDVFEEPFLALAQNDLLPFFQQQLPEGFTPNYDSYKAEGLLEYRMVKSEDPIGGLVRRLENLLIEATPATRMRHIKSLLGILSTYT